jgi:maltooligosyltrehalose trehalohydrolase
MKTDRHSLAARRLPIGAEIVGGSTHFRVWAPRHKRVDVVLERGGVRTLGEESEGYFSGTLEDVSAGAKYRFRLGGGTDLYPDPASRFQPDGPHGPSEVVDPSRFVWTDSEWKGIHLQGQVLYEMHVGTFTREGTWTAATRELEKLQGICTTIEIMPVADFPGDFGWGYDGVNLFAPTRLYGEPDDLRRFVDRAHTLGFGVLLDVVYNHVGPDGNYLTQFSDTYFTTVHDTEWGPAINYDAEGNSGVRELVVANAGYWIDEFHFDGLRLDATQAIHDTSALHVLTEIGQRVRACAGERSTIIVAENESQDTTLLRPTTSGGYGLDAVWNDDLHHSAHVSLTGHAEAYYSDHRGAPQEFVSGAKYGYLFQGQRYSWQKKARGTSSRGLLPERFVTFLENHDQVANSARSERLSSSAQPGRLRALTAFILLGPGTPMLFQGQEFASSAPFAYFAGHNAELATAVRQGRAEFLAQFPSIALTSMSRMLDDPSDPKLFARCKLDAGERERNLAALALHRDLFTLRRSDVTLRAQGRHGLDGAVLGAHSFVLRFFGSETSADRLLIVNLGPDIRLVPAPEPLLAPPVDARWSVRWSSEDPDYGGSGMPPADTEDGWRLKGESAVFLAIQDPHE